MKTIITIKVLTRIIGKPGKPERIAFDNEFKDEIRAHRFKDLGKKNKRITQAQLVENRD